MQYNFIIIVFLIIFLFFISSDPKTSKDIVKNNSIHIIIFTLIVYFVFNNLHLGYLIFGLGIIVLYFTEFKKVLIKQAKNIDFFNDIVELIEDKPGDDENKEVISDENNKENNKEVINDENNKGVINDEDNNEEMNKNETEEIENILNEIHESIQKS